MPHHNSIYQDEAAGNSVFNQEFLDNTTLSNLAQIQSQQTQNALADLAVSGENELNTIANA